MFTKHAVNTYLIFTSRISVSLWTFRVNLMKSKSPNCFGGMGGEKNTIPDLSINFQY